MNGIYLWCPFITGLVATWIHSGSSFSKPSTVQIFLGKIHGITELNQCWVFHSAVCLLSSPCLYCSIHGCSPSFTNSWSTLKEPDWRGWVGSFRLSWSIRYTSDWGGTEAVGSLKHRTVCEAVSEAVWGMACARNHKTWLSDNHCICSNSWAKIQLISIQLKIRYEFTWVNFMMSFINLGVTSALLHLAECVRGQVQCDCLGIVI